jgi:hypothetical protein
MIEGGAGALIKPPLASTALENSVAQAGCFFISASIFRLAVWTVHWGSIFVDDRILPNLASAIYLCTES